ncbi:MAG: Rab family GTPase [Candidatus Thermoplasmatota archaeon]
MELRRIKRKVLLLGDGAVGKTSLIRKYVLDRFDDKYITTIGTKVTKKVVEFKRHGEMVELTLMIWDVLGQRGYTTIQASSYQGAEGTVMVCDLTRKETLRSIDDYWLPNLTEVAGKTPIVLVGNKCDLATQIQITEGELKAYAQRLKAPCFRSSAKTGENVEALFKALGELVIEDIAPPSPPLEPEAKLAQPVTLIDAADAVIADFCRAYGDHETAMAIVRQQFTRAHVDINAPVKEGLLKAIEYLAEAERSFRSEEEVRTNMFRRKGIVNKVEE